MPKFTFRMAEDKHYGDESEIDSDHEVKQATWACLDCNERHPVTWECSECEYEMFWHICCLCCKPDEGKFCDCCTNLIHEPVDSDAETVAYGSDSESSPDA